MKLSYSDLLERCPVDILALITPLNERNGDFPWDVFAETCDGKARQHAVSDPRISLQWAAVAVSVYDCLSHKATGSVLQRIERHAMSLRATLIKKFGQKSGHPVLDPRMVEDWFFSRLDFSLRDFQSVQDIVDDPVVSLRVVYIWQRFAVLSPLLDAGYCTRCVELEEWKSAIESYQRGDR